MQVNRGSNGNSNPQPTSPRLTEQGHIECSCCRRNALRIVSEGVFQITNRHDGETHITTLTLDDLRRLLDKGVAFAAK